MKTWVKTAAERAGWYAGAAVILTAFAYLLVYVAVMIAMIASITLTVA